MVEDDDIRTGEAYAPTKATNGESELYKTTSHSMGSSAARKPSRIDCYKGGFVGDL